MAFVSDLSDPSGLGMFSKPGRYTSEKHIIFQKKEEILNNQRKFLKVTSLPNLKIDMGDKDPNKDPFEEEEVKPPPTFKKKEKPVFSTFEKSLSRGDVERIHRNRTQAPPVGFYNPKIRSTMGQTHVLFNYEKERKKPVAVLRTNSNIDQSIKELIEKQKHDPEMLQRKVVVPTPLRIQTARPKFYKDNNNPHDDRFEYLEVPQTSSRARKTPSFDFSKTMGRDKFKFYQSKEYQPDYNPNYDFGRKRMKSSGVNFDKTTPRKPLINQLNSAYDGFFDPAIVDKIKPNTSRSPRLDLMLSREGFGSPFVTDKNKTSRVNTARSKQSIKNTKINTKTTEGDRLQTFHSGFYSARGAPSSRK